MLDTEVLFIDGILQAVRMFQPTFGFQWLVTEIERNLSKELNFLLEAENANNCRQVKLTFCSFVVMYCERLVRLTPPIGVDVQKIWKPSGGSEVSLVSLVSDGFDHGF